MPFKLQDLFTGVFLIASAYFSCYKKKLTLPAAFTGFCSAMLIYYGTGYTGLSLMAIFFLAGTLATAWGSKTKKHLHRSGDDEQRKSSQVLANAGTAVLCAVLALIFPVYETVMLLLLAASFASATADTLSSELGMVYGKRFYNCISWKKEERGLDGVISMEGTLIGVAGALFIAFVYAVQEGFNSSFLFIVLAGIAGNFSDSVFGAALEREKMLNNDWVNFLSTLFSAIMALLLNTLFL